MDNSTTTTTSSSTSTSAATTLAQAHPPAAHPAVADAAAAPSDPHDQAHDQGSEEKRLASKEGGDDDGSTSTTPPSSETQIDPYLVYFKHGDPECPYYYSHAKKWTIVLVIALQIIWIAGLGASWSPANADIAAEFGVSKLVARIPQAMYLIGFSLGPVVLTPISEDYGRRWTFFICLVVLYIFQIPIALAKNLETLIIFRFLAGFIASPVFNSCCNVPDMWRSTDEFEAGFALNIWAFSAEIIVLAPIWGAYININLNWRWLWGISALVGIALALVFLIFVPETRHSVLLSRRARKLRKETGDDKYHAISEFRGRRSVKDVLTGTVYRPVFMLFTEPIVNLFALYDGLNYGIIYLAIEAVPIVYAAHGFHDPGVEFMFFSIVVGYIIAIAIFPFQWRLNQQLNKRNGGTVIPEGKLYWGFLAGIIFPISLYLFAWLGLPKIFWFASLVPLALFGVASHILFIMVSDYTVDSYGHLASSAVTGQSFARELLSATLIIVGEPFYVNLGPEIASTILAAIATVLGVLPFMFWRYGPSIRERSHYSQEIKKAAKEEEERARSGAPLSA